MRYKVGDRVRIKSVDWYYDNRDRIDEVACGNTNFIPDMVKYCEGIVTISSVLPTLGVYRIKEDGGMFNWTDEMIEGLPSGNPYEWECLEGYQFVDENGNVIEAKKIVLEKKKKEYPKTYEECCKVLNVAVRDLDILDNLLDTTEIIYSKNLDRLLNSFRKLLICRDAYWKIAGEEMGLGKPWKPNWRDGDKHKKVIEVKENNAYKNGYLFTKRILAFPTAEIRDAFYENFKELIEECKELL